MCFLTLYVTPRIEYEVCLRHGNSRSVYCKNSRDVEEILLDDVV